MKEKYYPRRMRTGWCVAHDICAAGVKIERYGEKCKTYSKAFVAAKQMNSKQLPNKAITT